MVRGLPGTVLAIWALAGAPPLLAQGCYVGGAIDGVVGDIRLSLGEDASGNTQGRIGARVAATGRVETRTLYCFPRADGRLQCSGDCDTGTLVFTRLDGAGATFSTRYFTLGEGEMGCTEVANITGIAPEDFEAAPVAVELVRAPGAACGF